MTIYSKFPTLDAVLVKGFKILSYFLTIFIISLVSFFMINSFVKTNDNLTNYKNKIDTFSLFYLEILRFNNEFITQNEMDKLLSKTI